MASHSRQQLQPTQENLLSLDIRTKRNEENRLQFLANENFENGKGRSDTLDG